MQFTEIEPLDLIEFCYNGTPRALHVLKVTTNGANQYIEGDDVVEGGYKKFSWKNVSDVKIVDQKVAKGTVSVNVKEPGFKAFVGLNHLFIYKPEEKKPVKSGLYVSGNNLVDKDGNVLVSNLSDKVVEAFTA